MFVTVKGEKPPYMLLLPYCLSLSWCAIMARARSRCMLYQIGVPEACLSVKVSSVHCSPFGTGVRFHYLAVNISHVQLVLNTHGS